MQARKQSALPDETLQRFTSTAQERSHSSSRLFTSSAELPLVVAFAMPRFSGLENMASDIAVGLAVLAAAKTEQRLKREAEQRKVEEERRQRERAPRVKHMKIVEPRACRNAD